MHEPLNDEVLNTSKQIHVMSFIQIKVTSLVLVAVSQPISIQMRFVLCSIHGAISHIPNDRH